MKLLDILTAPWAIQPEKLLEMQEIYATHLRGDKIDLEAVEARLGRPLANEQQEYTVDSRGVAVLPIDGVIAHKANMFTRISGGASSQMLSLQVESALLDARVKALVLFIDSPGGVVNGGFELAEQVFAFGQQKPVVTVSDGALASLAYLIGAAANAVYVTGPAVEVGSIGVVRTHDYRPAPSATAGGRTTEITAGRYKRIATPLAPLSDEGRAYLQADVDYLYSIFVDHVAAYRGVSAEAVLEHMADGRVFRGQQAVDVGLVDGISTLDQITDLLAEKPQTFATRRKAQVRVAVAAAGTAGAAALDEPAADMPPGDSTLSGENRMNQDTVLTRESLERDHAALFEQVRSEFVALGATRERERIQAVEAQLIRGHEALINTMKYDGKSTAGDAAQAVLAAERTLQSNALKALADEAPKPVPQLPAPAAELTPEQKAHAELAGLTLEDRCKKQWDTDASLRQEFGSLGAYTAFARAEADGRARIKKG